ncbi:hypothetical protein COMA1_11487 [Candidatus Nitrospira nitrosa]|uniref:Uncharacterized protein n=2 Tax=Candidatus Nitrospira nitrosa TaxID=1742972 RepID=A0A0S4L8D0_9BACT|nr:hypothetical protein COMA1_11487 [Candidatus Nitrospira nitrosa]
MLLVNDLFKYVGKIANLDVGCSIRFDRSHDPEELIGFMTNYIMLEYRNSPQLTCPIGEEPHDQMVWLQIRIIVRTSCKRNACTALDCSESSLGSRDNDRFDPESNPLDQPDANGM